LFDRGAINRCYGPYVINKLELKSIKVHLTLRRHRVYVLIRKSGDGVKRLFITRLLITSCARRLSPHRQLCLIRAGNTEDHLGSYRTAITLMLHSNRPVFPYPIFIVVQVVIRNPEGLKELSDMMIGLFGIARINNNTMPEFSGIAKYVKHNFKFFVT
jgi:hypothetical protein